MVSAASSAVFVEATVGFEPTNRGFADLSDTQVTVNAERKGATIDHLGPHHSAVNSAVDDHRFRAKVRTSDDCWEWTGYRDRQGYGHLTRDKVNHLAHRYAYALAFGEPSGVVRHTCDNPPCVRPDHLLDGTQADNIADRQARGRHRPGRLSGEDHSQAKLTLAQVRDIRSRPRVRGSVKWMAEEFGVTRPTIHRILNGTGWREEVA